MMQPKLTAILVRINVKRIAQLFFQDPQCNMFFNIHTKRILEARQDDIHISTATLTAPVVY